MSLSIYLDGTTGGTDGTLEVPNDGVGVNLSGIGSVGTFHLRCSSGYATSESVAVTAPAGCTVSKDGVTYADHVDYAAEEIGDTNAICYLKNVSATPSSVGLVSSPRLSLVSTSVVVDDNAPVLSGTLTAIPGDTQVELDWSDATDDVGVTGYNVEYGSTVSYGYSIPDVTVSSATLSGLVNGTVYYFRVRGYDAAGNASDWLSTSAIPALLYYSFTAADDDTAAITDDFYSWANIITSGAVIDVNEMSVQSNSLSTRLTPTANSKFLIREFIGKSGFSMPTSGQTLYLEATVGYPAVRENQIGLGVNSVSVDTNPGTAGTWGTETSPWGGTSGAHRFRGHFSQSASLSAQAARVEHLDSDGNLTSISFSSYTALTGQSWVYRLASEYVSLDTYTLTMFVNGTQVHQSTGVHFQGDTAYPYLYNQVGFTNSEAVTFDDFRVWVEGADVAPVVSGTLTATPSDAKVTLFGPTATDDVEIVKWQYNVDSGLWVDIASTSGTMPSTDVTGLTNGTEYDFCVRVLDAAERESNMLSGTATPAVQSFLFDGADGSSGYTDVLNVWPNKIYSDAVIDISTHSIQSDELSTRITPTASGKFVVTEFISKSALTMPTAEGDKLVVEAKLTYDATVRENQAGIGILAATSDPGSGSSWASTADRSGIRLHLSQSAALSAATMVFTQKVGTVSTNTGSVSYTVPLGTQFALRFEAVKRADGKFDVYGYEDGVLKTSNTSGISYADATGYLTFYNQVASPTAAAIAVDDFRTWVEV